MLVTKYHFFQKSTLHKVSRRWRERGVNTILGKLSANNVMNDNLLSLTELSPDQTNSKIIIMRHFCSKKHIAQSK